MTTALLQRSDVELLADMREVAEVMCGLASTAGLSEDDLRRAVWLLRKQALPEYIEVSTA